MLRALLTAVFVSCFFGTLFGISIAYSFLAVNGWQPESEMKTYENLIQTARGQMTNPNAKAFIEETVHNFGYKDVKASGTHDFFIKNIGTEDLILKLDRTSCSCTDIVITPNRVQPGKTATCHLIYSAERAITGKFSQGGILATNDPDNREIRLLVEGVFTSPVVMQPTAVNFPGVPANTTRTRTVRFYSFENEPLQLSAPTWTDREHFDFQWIPIESPETKESDTYLSAAKWVVEGTFTVKPGLPIGSFQDRFQIATNYPSLPSVTLALSGQIVGGNVSISGQGYNRTTGAVDLGRTEMGTSFSREISIQFSGPLAGSASVQVKAVEPSWIRTKLSPPRDFGTLRIFPMKIEIPQEAPTGSYVFGSDGQQAFVMLETNDEDMPVVRIPLQFVVGKQ